MRRIKIKDIAMESGVSRATVDRVLNSRPGVRLRTRAAVEAAMRRLAAPDSSGGFQGRPFDAVLRLGGGMAQQCRDAMASYLSAGCRLYDMFQQDEDAILAHIDELAGTADRPLIVAVKDTSRMRSRLSKLRRAGKTVVAMVTDLASDSRDAFVGIDNRAAGQAAAFIVGRSLGDRPTSVGVVLGDYAFRCHQDREIGFRSALRDRFPKVVLAAEAHGEDNPDRTYEETLGMLRKHPAISAIYNVSGGNAGLARAVREAGRVDDITIISHEVNAVTLPLLHDGVFDYLIAQDPALLISEAAKIAAAAVGDSAGGRILDFFVHTCYNIPEYARPFQQ